MNNSHSPVGELFPDIRASGETKLRQCQLVMIRMVKIFDHLANKYEFNYWLDAGSLLGAVREKGFIPWDCDIDIGILPEDYEKFRRLAAHELPDDIFLQDTDTDPYYHREGVAKLRDKYSNYHGWAAQMPGLKYHNGLQVELCIRENIYPPWGAAVFNRVSKVVRKVMNYHDAYWRFYGLSYQSVFPLIPMEFEDSMLPCPQGYESYLRFMFGDYMQPPPPDKRVPANDGGEPFIPCSHREILFWNEESRAAWTAINHPERIGEP